ncbi:MAG: DeoR family transcriptional regulator [Lachnospiraceae bacterium]
MYQKERKQQILYLLQEKNEMTVAELSRLLFTSESSIRRDLQTMELTGWVADMAGELLSDNPTIVPFASRLHYKVAEKKNGEKALSIFRMDRSFSRPVLQCALSPMSW